MSEASQYDLIVVGFGAAGAAAAITAADLGASVLIVEKQTQAEHMPSSRMSGGVIMAVGDAERAAPYMHRCAGEITPFAVTRAWAERGEALLAWLQGRGVALDYVRVAGGEHVRIEGADAIDVYSNGRRKDGGLVDLSVNAASGSAMMTYPDGRPIPASELRTGEELWADLAKAVRDRGVAIQWAASAERLIQDGTGRVVGVRCLSDDGGRLELPARRGVVLTCGGFEQDEELKRQFLKASPMYFYGGVGNTGDGVRMAQKAGAALWHMTLAVGRGIVHFPLGDGTWLNATPRLRPGGYLITDKHGRRFADEHPQAQLSHAFLNELIYFDAEAAEYPRIPAYLILDARRMAAGPLVSHVGGAYHWSADNAEEVARGWVSVGDTVEAAARSAGVLDPASVAAEVARYNDGCAVGVDRFGRPADSLTPLDAPPFYCLPLYPGGSNTSGGPRRDERARILDAFDEPIPGLFGAGELGQAVGMLYPAFGAALSEAFCFGQIAAEEAITGGTPSSAVAKTL